jgi:hypothetical protein
MNLLVAGVPVYIKMVVTSDKGRIVKAVGIKELEVKMASGRTLSLRFQLAAKA